MSAFKKEVESFIQELPFPLTQDQNKAVEEIVHDMKQGTPMNRLLEGDVGTGKTIVAIIAAYLAYLNGEKTLYMAPTEILANQHFDTFKNFLNEKNIKITLKTGTTKKSTKESEKWDIVIGTHALLYDRDGYENVGLVIIDEQHRFGVEQRAKLLEYEKEQRTPHLLTMTATPIPRTLALTLYGDLSISVLKDPPNLEKKITTWVVNEKKREDAFEWVKKQKEQVFVVCPFIEESTSADLENVKSAKAEYEKLKAGVFSHVKVGLLHGRMKAKEKDEVLGRFRKKEIDVLVSTPVIEVGVDIPEANIMVIESAERYGLASLHQLRGRVGRGEREAFCLIFPSNFSKSSIRRLKYLEKLNSGLDLAEIDMKLRGHGEIYGTVQHGYKKFKIADVTNVNMLENAKRAAQETLPKLSEFSQLKDKLDNISLDALSKN